MRLHFESHPNVAVRMARCNIFIGGPDPCARALAGVPHVGVLIAGEALIMDAVRQVEAIDPEAVAGG